MIRGRSALLLLALLLGGCAHLSRPPVPPLQASLELQAVPFFPQTAYQCGPAALATVLNASGVTVPPEALAPQVFLPGRKGSLQLELVAAARRQQRVPYVLPPQPEALLGELAAGRPVLVLQNLGVSWLPVWHYAVLVGVDAERNLAILRSGREARLQMRWSRFLDSWRRGGSWALVTAAPEDPPATAAPLPWLQAASAFEQLRRPELAVRAYEAAIRRWPGEPLPWQLLGNARYAARDLPAARAAYREAAARAADASAYNNLAQTELELGCAAAAAAALDKGGKLPASPAVAEALRETRAALAALPPGAVCQP